jgi:hypothetical protein
MARLARVVVPGLPNPVHFIMTPGHEDGLRATFAEAHHR